MKKIILLFCLTLLLAGCSPLNEEKMKLSVQKELDKFYENLLLEDLDSVMTSLSSNSEQYYSLYDEFRETFSSFNYNYKVEEIQFKDITKESITASVYAQISGVDENDVYDSFSVIHEFSFVPANDGSWKISSMDTLYDF